MSKDEIVLERIRRMVATGRVDEEFSPKELNEVLEYAVHRLEVIDDGYISFCPTCGTIDLDFETSPIYIFCNNCKNMFVVE
jgi:hypothetical protein